MTRIRQNPRIRYWSTPMALGGWAAYAVLMWKEELPFAVLISMPAMIASIFLQVGTSLSASPRSFRLGSSTFSSESIIELRTLEDESAVFVRTSKKLHRISRWAYHPEDWIKFLSYIGGERGRPSAINQHLPEEW